MSDYFHSGPTDDMDRPFYPPPLIFGIIISSLVCLGFFIGLVVILKRLICQSRCRPAVVYAPRTRPHLCQGPYPFDWNGVSNHHRINHQMSQQVNPTPQFAREKVAIPEVHADAQSYQPPPAYDTVVPRSSYI